MDYSSGVSDLAGPTLGQRICISNKFSSDTEGELENHCFRLTFCANDAK